MKTVTKGLCALLLCGMTVSLLPVEAAQIAALTMTNTNSQTAEVTLRLETYSKSASQRYEQQDFRQLSTTLNTISMGGDLQFTALSGGVTIYVDVLTNLNGDGYYEWIVGEDDSRYILSKNDGLVACSAIVPTMSKGETRTLSVADLLALGMSTEQSRTADGATPLAELSLATSGDIVYVITMAAADGSEESYYLQLDYNLDPSVSVDQLGAGVFQDVPSWVWYWDEVDWAVRSGILNGNSATVFGSDSNTTRAALMQVLYSMAETPEVDLVDFSDVSYGDWFADAVSWGSQQGLVSGYSNGTFQPNTAITREQLAVILYRWVEDNGSSTQVERTDLYHFSDGATTSSWAQTAVCWAVDWGILDEQDGGLLNPQGTVSRANLADILMTLEGL